MNWPLLKRHVNTQYHFGVDRVGSGYEIILGAPRNGFPHLHIAITGNFDVEAPGPKQVDKVVELLERLLTHYKLGPSAISGKPGKYFPMNTIKARLA